MAKKETADNEPQKNRITAPDRILRELNIIETIFKSQYLKYDETDPFPYLLNKDGRSGIDGRYIISIYFLSDVELFNLQQYKKEFTNRFEGTSNISLVKNQLLEIKEKATEVRDYYNTNLTKSNKIVDDFIAKSKSLDTLDQFQERLDFLESHRSVATVSNYHIMEIYLGTDLGSKHAFWNRDRYTYTYLSDNSQLASICQRLIDFVNKFDLEYEKANRSITKNNKNKMSKNFETEIRETFNKKY